MIPSVKHACPLCGRLMTWSGLGPFDCMGCQIERTPTGGYRDWNGNPIHVAAGSERDPLAGYTEAEHERALTRLAKDVAAA